LPRVGRDLGVDPDKVAALEPDLVLASLTVPGHEEVVARLEVAELPYVVTQPTSLEDVYADILLIAEKLDVVERGEELVASMRAEIVPRRVGETSETEPGGKLPSVLVSWWPNPIIGAARRSWVHDLIELAGGRSILSGEDRESVPLDHERIVELAPDHFVISWCGVPEHRYRKELVLDEPALAGIPAVKKRQVHAIREAYLGRPGPRLVEGYHALCHILASS
jgi:iron complex transport system substrate-binding protein